MTTAAAPGSAATPTPARVTARIDRLQRLLALVPYVVSRNVVGLAETAAAFGITERELVDDLNMLWCVELRSPDPYCPIDLSYEGGEIVVSEAESIDRPLRLGVDEASALLVALRMLAEVPNLEDRSALSRTIAKLEAAAGAAGAASAQVAVQVDDRGRRQPAGPDPRRAAAAAGGCTCPITCPGRDEATERDVDPMRLLVVEGRTYLEGWCLRAEAVRLFRLDRVLALTVLDQAAVGPAPGRAQGRGPGPVPAVGRGRRRWSSSCRPRAAGWPSTTRASGWRIWATAGSGRAAHPGHPVGPAACPAPRRRRPGDLARRSWPPRSARTPPPPWPSTPEPPLTSQAPSRPSRALTAR